MNNQDNLVSINDLKQQIKAFKVLGIFMSKEQRRQCKNIEEQLDKMINQMSVFSDRFTPLGWCMYDSMKLSMVENANSACDKGGIGAGENVLMDYYKNEVRNSIPWLYGKSKELALRRELIECAFEEHFAERYYASVPLFLIIADGAVNDFTKSKGLFAEGTMVTAWDCLVGCNDSLDNIKNIFNEMRGKTRVEEIRMPYRNGILHGRNLNYGNEYVSCKCVALLFAIAEWMAMKNSENTRKEKYQKEHDKVSFRQICESYNQINKDKQNIREWKKRAIVIGKDIPECGDIESYKDFPYIIPVIQFIQYWKSNNYGMLARVLIKNFSYENSEKKRAGEARKLFFNKMLLRYSLVEIEERASCLTKVVVNVEWKCNDDIKTGNLILGIVYASLNENQTEIILPWKNNGEWIIHPWDITDLYTQ